MNMCMCTHAYLHACKAGIAIMALGTLAKHPELPLKVMVVVAVVVLVVVVGVWVASSKTTDVCYHITVDKCEC